MFGREGEADGKDTPISWTSRIKKLFLKKNPEKSTDVLEELIGAVVDMSEAFLLQFDEDHVPLIAEKMGKMEVWDLKTFANDSKMFNETSPTWIAEGSGCDAPDVGKAACHVHTFLLGAREKFAKMELEGADQRDRKPRKRESSSRGRSRGRKSRKSKRQRASGDSDASSSGSSVKRQEAAEDLSKIISKSEFKDIPLEFFPLAKIAVKTYKRCQSGGTLLSSEAIEKWIPQYIGSELPSAGQKKVVAEREKSVNMTLAHLLEQATAFWLSHGIAGRVVPGTVMRHMMLLVKIASQTSTAVAVQYERMLIQHIRNLKGEPDLNVLLCDKVDAVETAVNIHFSRSAKPKDPPPISKPQQAGGFTRVKLEEGTASASHGAPQRAGQAKPDRGPSVNKKVCFGHNPAAKKSCKFGDKCRMEHLDTTVPKNKERFEKALRAVGQR